MEETILYFALKYEGDFDKIYTALETKEKVDETLKIKLFKELKSNYATLISKDYPKSLKEISCPPFVLFYYGDLSLINNKTISIVGTTHPSDYGIDVTNLFTEQLVKNEYTIITGLSLGIEMVVQEYIIKNKGKMVSVLGSGIDLCYPESNNQSYKYIKNKGLIISEYPNNFKASKKSLISRKRIISGLSNCILATELNIKSSAMITIGHGLEQGKNIYSVPSDIKSSMQGCNELIKQGAYLFKDIKDIEN